MSIHRLLERCLIATVVVALCAGWFGSDDLGSDPFEALPSAQSPINYAIQVAGPLAMTDARVGSVAQTSLIWRFVSSDENPEESSYIVTSKTVGVQIAFGSGNSLPDRYLSTDLYFKCSNPGLVEAEFAIEVENARTSLVWPVFCAGQHVDIKPVALGTAAIGQQALTTLMWRYENVGDDAKELPYSVNTNVESLVIEPNTGTALADSEMTTSLAQECTEKGASKFDLSIVVGTATIPVVWNVLCTEETVAIELPPTAVVASIGERARAKLMWQVLSSNDETDDVAYVVSSSEDGVDITNASGNVSTGTSLTHDLAFSCKAEGSVQVELTIQAGSASQSLTWTIECSAEEIEIIEPPRTVGVPLGASATAALRWQLNSNSTQSREFEFSVQTSSTSVQIGNASGIVVPHALVVNDLMFECESEGQFDHPVTLTAAQVTTNTIWTINCVEGSIAIESSPSKEVVRVGKSVFAELTWEFRSSQADREVSFQLSSKTSGLQMRNSYGQVLAGDSVVTTLRYACSSRRYVTADVHMQVGDLTRTIEWPIECLGEDLTNFVARFYQGPLIATVEFEERDGNWTQRGVGEEDAVVPVSLQFRTNRQVFVEVTTQHDEREPLPFAVHMKSAEQSIDMAQIGEARVQTLPDDAATRYEESVCV